MERFTAILGGETGERPTVELPFDARERFGRVRAPVRGAVNGVAPAPPRIPQALVDQLAVGGTMVLPVGTAMQEMTVVTKTARGVTQRRTIPVRFVPMVEQR